MKNNNLGKPVGIISQISDDITLEFVSNSNVTCNISDLIFLKTNDSYVVAQIKEIKINYYLENADKYFISKAVENELNKIPANSPRFGQIVIATILGHYQLSSDSFTEIKFRINRYTPKILQEVYLVDIERIPEIFGLVKDNSDKKIFVLGHQLYPLPRKEGPIKLFFNSEIFKRHSLITGVTGAGKSRLAALIIRQLANAGAHVSVLDPHDEYSALIKNGKYSIFKFSVSGNEIEKNSSVKTFSGKLTFYEKSLSPNTLTRLLPFLSIQQENLLYEVFDTQESNELSLKTLIDCLVKELNIEIRKEDLKMQDKIKGIHQRSIAKASNDTKLLNDFINELKHVYDLNKNSRLGVLMALISKVNELRLKNLISSIEPNWLKFSPQSIDIFSIDYSANEYIRRFINSIIQFFLRKKDSEEMRFFVIDEAHLLLRDNLTTISLLKQLLREGRKYGISIIFISQNKMDIPDDVRSQFQNHFMFREINSETQYFPDQVCEVVLYGSKSKFAMKVETVE